MCRARRFIQSNRIRHRTVALYGKNYAAANTEITLTIADNASSDDLYKVTGIKGATKYGNAYKYTAKGDTMLEFDGFPKITGLTFNTEGEYYEINSTDDLSAIENFIPIGNGNSFDGTFDGCGHTISNLNINSSVFYVGLFGWVSSGIIQNVNLINAEVKGDNSNYTGRLVGVLSGSVNNCSIGGNINVSGKTYTGGFVEVLNSGAQSTAF